MTLPEQAVEWALCIMELSVLLSIRFNDERDTDLWRESICIPVIHGEEGRKSCELSQGIRNCYRHERMGYREAQDALRYQEISGQWVFQNGLIQ